MESSTITQNNNDILISSSESGLVILFLHDLIKKRWLILIIFILGAIGGYIYASTQKTLYSSSLSFALDEGGSEGNMTGALGIAAQLGFSLGGAKDVFTGDNILEIMMSRRIIENVLLSVDTFNNKPYTLIEYYRKNLADRNDINKNTSGINFFPGDLKNNFSYTKDSILYRTYIQFHDKYISARRPDKKLNIYEVSVTSLDEKFTKVFTDKLIKETNDFYVEISSKKAKETLDILEKTVPTMKSKLNQSINSAASVQDANLNPAFSAAQVPLLIDQANTQVYGAAYAESFKNLEIARFQYLKSIPLMQIIDPANYPMQKVTTGKLKSAIIFSILAVFLFILVFGLISFVSNMKKYQLSRL